jgi:hypothetical protein
LSTHFYVTCSGHEKFSRLSRRLETAFSINWIIAHAVVAIASNHFHRRSVSVAQRYKQERLMGAVMVRCPQTGRDIPTGLVTDRKSFEATPVFFARVYCPICRTQHEWFAKEAWVCEAEPRPEQTALL